MPDFVESARELSRRELLEMGAKPLSDLPVSEGQFAGYLYFDNPESEEREIYEPTRKGYVLRRIKSRE